MRVQLTRIEQLDRLRPALKLEREVTERLHRGNTLEEIQAFIKEKTGERLAFTNIAHYKQARWLKQKKRIEEMKERSEAILDVLGKHGVSEVAQAQLFEQVDAAMRDGKELDPHFLMAEQRKWAELKLKREQLEQANKKLELQVQQRDAERAKVAEAVTNGEKDPTRTVERIREIYGLPA